jgi:hypothetical protein
VERIAAEPKFSAKALDAFRAMHALESQCTCSADSRKPCAACEAWRDQDRILFFELKLTPWQFPAVERPGTVPPYDKGVSAYQECLMAQRRYCELAAAAL